MEYTIRYLNYTLKISLSLPIRSLITFDSDVADQINFIRTRFSEGNLLFKKEKNIYIDVISVRNANDNENKGYLRDLINGILDNGYNVIVLNPLGFRMNSILKKYGFRKYITDHNTPMNEPYTIMYVTQEMKDLPKIFAGCVGFNEKENLFAFAFYTERGKVLGHIYSEIGDNYDIAYDSCISKLDAILSNESIKTPPKIRKRIQHQFPNGYRLSFLVTSEERDFFTEWYDKNVMIS